jgi:hypothetical protein
MEPLPRAGFPSQAPALRVHTEAVGYELKMQVLPALLNLDTRAVHTMTSADRHDRSLMASRLKYSSCMGLARSRSPA